jgi:hypothetical protein
MDVSELTWAGRIDLESSLRTKRHDIARLVQLKFGRVLPEVDVLINAPATEEELDALFDRVFAAKDEHGLLS